MYKVTITQSFGPVKLNSFGPARYNPSYLLGPSPKEDDQPAKPKQRAQREKLARQKPLGTVRSPPCPKKCEREREKEKARERERERESPRLEERARQNDREQETVRRSLGCQATKGCHISPTLKGRHGSALEDNCDELQKVGLPHRAPCSHASKACWAARPMHARRFCNGGPVRQGAQV